MIQRRHPDADAHINLSARYAHFHALDTAPNALGDNAGIGTAGTWQHDEKFLAAITAKIITLTQLVDDLLDYRFEAFVAGAVAVGIVYTFKEVDVEK